MFFFIPSLFFEKASFITCRVWSRFVCFLLKHICRIDHKIIGLENIPKNSPYIIASKHQSAWETISFLFIFNVPVFVYKKELLKLPIFSSYLKRTKMIPIDRRNPKSAINTITKSCAELKGSNRAIIIFPEGTRTRYGSKTKIKPGIYLIAKQTGYPVIPVSLDSGKFWSREQSYKKPGIITVKIGKEIPLSENKNDFLKDLENKI